MGIFDYFLKKDEIIQDHTLERFQEKSTSDFDHFFELHTHMVDMNNPSTKKVGNTEKGSSTKKVGNTEKGSSTKKVGNTENHVGIFSYFTSKSPSGSPVNHNVEDVSEERLKQTPEKEPEWFHPRKGGFPLHLKSIEGIIRQYVFMAGKSLDFIAKVLEDDYGYQFRKERLEEIIRATPGFIQEE